MPQRATQALTNVPAASTVWLDPQLTGLRFRRKAVVISNEDAAVSLWFVDEAGNLITRIPPDREMILPVSGKIGVRNVSGAPVSVSVGGIYWTF